MNTVFGKDFEKQRLVFLHNAHQEFWIRLQDGFGARQIWLHTQDPPPNSQLGEPRQAPSHLS